MEILETIRVDTKQSLLVVHVKNGYYMQWETLISYGPRIGTAKNKPYKTLAQLKESKTYKYYKT